VSAPAISGKASVSPRTPIDLTNCDREPIHIPGAIQPHGILLALDESDGRVKQASSNASDRLGRAVLGAALGDAVGAEAAATIREALARGHVRTDTSVATRHGVFAATVHRSGGLAIIELEPAGAEPTLTPDSFRDTIREALAHIESATKLSGLAGQIASQMRRLTGFDRVWVYRFHEDWHGEIIGESKRDGIAASSSTAAATRSGLARVQSTQLQISVQVFASYAALQTATDRVAAAVELLAAAQQSSDVAQGRYREGVGTIIDVLLARSALASARADHIQARWEWRISLAQLAHDVGVLDTGGRPNIPLSPGPGI
jgi:hypothetical protein